MALRGRFITLEGGEGAGKSTQLQLLGDWLAETGIQVVKTREPGGSTGAERIRELLVNGETDRWTPVAETLLHYAARCDHVERTVLPALRAGRWVISDRFADSTLAYQGYGHGVDQHIIAVLHQAVVGDASLPDLTFILDLPVEEGLRRAAMRHGSATRYEAMDIDFHRRLRDGFLTIARRHRERCIVIDALAPIENVQASMRSTIAARLLAPAT